LAAVLLVEEGKTLSWPVLEDASVALKSFLSVTAPEESALSTAAKQTALETLRDVRGCGCHMITCPSWLPANWSLLLLLLLLLLLMLSVPFVVAASGWLSSGRQ
jgi:hypothetical protein